MTLYICSYCNRLAVTLWPVEVGEKTLSLCWTCIEEAADRSRFDVVHDFAEVSLVPTITKVEVQG
jgi:hypothetical protein